MATRAAPQQTWGDDLRAYEHEKRTAVHEGLLRGPPTRISNGQIAFQERTFDPLLQRYRDSNTEGQQRFAEEKERVNHLNRAQDIQIIREQPFHIIHGHSKLEALAPGQDPMRLGGGPTLSQSKRATGPNGSYPDTALCYNMISNLPYEEHHWAKPEDRPRIKAREMPQRMVPQHQVKDFHIISNRYLDGDSERKKHDKHQALAHASAKFMTQSLFDPVTQEFQVPEREEAARVAEHASQVESNLRAEVQKPPCIRARESAFYDMVSHNVHDKRMLKVYDDREKERKDRKQNRYIVEHNLHLRDVKGDHINESRKLNRVAPERFEEEEHRGYDIIDNRSYGHLAHKQKTHHEAYCKRRISPWEQAMQGRSDSRLATSGSAGQLRPAAPSARSAPAAPSTAASGSQPSRRSAPMARSASTPAMRPTPPPGRTPPPGHTMPWAAPPAPLIPGTPLGSVYSQGGRSGSRR